MLLHRSITGQLDGSIAPMGRKVIVRLKIDPWRVAL
jgi:hypothetical protein